MIPPGLHYNSGGGGGGGGGGGALGFFDGFFGS